MFARPLVLALLPACAETAFSARDEAFASTDGPTAATTSGGFEDTGFAAPPETEADRLALPPAQTDVYVFVANPDNDTVTRIQVLTSEVRTTPVGIHPTKVLTTPDYARAVVLNEGDDTVSILTAATLEQTVVEVRDSMNQLALSPDGAWALLWHDAGADDDDGDTDGVVSYNEASLVEVATGRHVPMVVGYKPRQVVFTQDGRLAAMVSDDYLALIDLTAPDPAPELIELAPDDLDPPSAQEAILEATGSWAYVRQFGTNDLLVVDLFTHAIQHVPVGANPTDMDLSPDGATTAVVARDDQTLWLLQALDPFAPAEVLPLPPGLSAGQLVYDPTGRQGVLFTTSTLVDRYATWDVETGAVVDRSLVKPASTVSVSPDGNTLLVFHTKSDGPETDESFAGEWAMSMISLQSFLASPVVLPDEPTAYAHANDGSRGYFIMEDAPSLIRLDYTTLLFQDIPLRSNPVYLGVLPDLDPADGLSARTWVSQDHDLGRISFYDPDDDSLETITGFELNSGIEQ